MTEHTAEAWESFSDSRGQAITIGRYILHRQIARGGMATIHIARLMGDEGFSRIVAAKRLLPEFAEDADFVAMFLDEARVASKVHHRNVVPVLDLVTTGDEVILVQEYVHGAPLHWLLRTARQTKTHIPIDIAVSIACQVLAGLHAAHETVDEIGMPLNIVHRDVSPQNIMVSLDGSARLLDFGVAKATMAAHITREHTFKGKLAYSAPEQLRGAAVRQSDVYSLAVVLWELIVGHRMHDKSQSEQEIVASIMMGTLPSVTEALAGEKEWIAKERWRQLEVIEPIIKKGLAVELHARYADAAAMEKALAAALPPTSSTGVASWLKSLGREFLDGRDKVLAAEEASWRRTAAPGRLTPLPGERRSMSRLSSEVSNARSVGSLTQQPKSKSTLIIATLASLVVILGIGIVFALNSGDTKPDPSRAPVATDPPPTATSMQPAPQPAVAAPQPPPVDTRPAPLPPVVDPPAMTVVKQTPPPPAQVIRRLPPRPAPVPVKAAVTTKAPVKAPTPAPPPEQAAPANDCNPPYYFEGSKKIFKPNCI
ncbi:MAG TPA: protein kinase [Kofleriaceae bacterium]|jgi:serine/threonine-protein kinase|nr:protein kinase [Kofleriaceae bacterium]